jgi:hypothetical protein
MKMSFVFLLLLCRETPVVESKVTEKVVEDVEDTPVVASGEETETPAPVEDAPAAPATTTKEEVPAVESTGDAPAEVTENGNGDAVAVVEPVVVVEAGKFFTLMTPSCAIYSLKTSLSLSLSCFRRVCKAKSW